MYETVLIQRLIYTFDVHIQQTRFFQIWLESFPVYILVRFYYFKFISRGDFFTNKLNRLKAISGTLNLMIMIKSINLDLIAILFLARGLYALGE